jgi:hypothetical protein
MDEMEIAATEWIEAITDEKFGQTPFGDVMRDGIILCRLINCIVPGKIPESKISSSKFAFKQACILVC